MRFDSIGRVDHKTGTTTTHYVGDTSATQEPLFVPRAGATSEGDGYVIALVNRYASTRSDLLILDAENVDGEPLATIALPLRLRNGLHGTWLDADQVAGYQTPSRDRDEQGRS
jgi:carotenoid cleavage dioxygenase-like enzyme